MSPDTTCPAGTKPSVDRRPTVSKATPNMSGTAEELRTLQRAFQIAKELRVWRQQQLKRGRPAVPETEVHSYADMKFPDVPDEIRRVICRFVRDRLPVPAHESDADE
jgi:hypothetical protein